MNISIIYILSKHSLLFRVHFSLIINFNNILIDVDTVDLKYDEGGWWLIKGAIKVNSCSFDSLLGGVGGKKHASYASSKDYEQDSQWNLNYCWTTIEGEVSP